MTGPKTNERPGVRAQVKYVRTSAYKAREVLDLIRDQQVGTALEILEFTEREIASVILKCLESAIANAAHDHDLPDADELYVSACYADEGPTLKRFRPRARGRASRIRKRTCHITVIVSRLPAERLEVISAAAAASGSASVRTNRAAAQARSERVARSRQTKAEKKAAAEAAEHEGHDHGDEGHDHEGHDHEGHDHEGHDHEDDGVEDTDTTPVADVDESPAGDDAETSADVDADEEKDS